MTLLSEMGRLRTGVTGAKLKAAGLPLLKLSQLERPTLQEPLEPILQGVGPQALERYRLSPGEVVISLAKRPLRASSVPEGVAVFASENFAVWTPHPQYQESSAFVALYLAQHTEAQLEGRTTVVHGTTVVTLSVLSRTHLALPPLEVQGALLEFSDRLHRLEQTQREVQSAQRALFDQIFRSIIQEDL